MHTYIQILPGLVKNEFVHETTAISLHFTLSHFTRNNINVHNTPTVFHNIKVHRYLLRKQSHQLKVIYKKNY